MRTVNLFIVAIVVLAITSCIPSIHPIYNTDTQVYDPALLGSWTSAEDDQVWDFGPGLRQDNTYLLTQTDQEGNSGEFTVHLAEIGGALFIDLFPEEWKSEENGFYWLHYYPMHTFMKVELDDNELRMYLLDIEWLDIYLKANPGAVAHTFSNRSPGLPDQDNTWPVLIAPTGELQAFLAAVASEPEAWFDPIELVREVEVVRDDWEVRIEGDKLYIDEESWLAKRYLDSGNPSPVFHRFDGVYLREWDLDFMLPAGFFLQSEKIELQEVSEETRKGPAYLAGARSIRFKGLSPLSIDETVSWFRDQGLNAGLKFTTDELESTVGGLAWEIEEYGPGMHYLGFHDEQGRFYHVYLNVWLLQDLGEYTYVTCAITVDTTK